MFHWICPECGREIPPAVKECPACDPHAATAAAVPERPAAPPVEPERPLNVLLAFAESIRAGQQQASPAAEPAGKTEPKRVAKPAPVAATEAIKEPERVVKSEPALEAKPAPPGAAEPVARPPAVAKSAAIKESAEPIQKSESAAKPEPSAAEPVAPPAAAKAEPIQETAAEPAIESIAELEPAAPIAEEIKEPKPVATASPVAAPEPVQASEPAAKETVAEAAPVAAVEPEPVKFPEPARGPLLLAEPPQAYALLPAPRPTPVSPQAVRTEQLPQIASPLPNSAIPESPARELTPQPAEAVSVDPIKPEPTAPPAHKPGPPLAIDLAASTAELPLAENPPSGSWLQLAGLQDYRQAAHRAMRPAEPPLKIVTPDAGPRITLPGPALPPQLHSLQAAQLTVLKAPEPRAARTLPGWMVSLLFVIGIPAVGAALLFYFMPLSRSNAETKAPAPEPQTAVVQAASHPLAQYIEVTGFRFIVDLNKKSEIHYLVVNHSGAELSDVTVYVTLHAADEQAGQPPVCRFSFRAPTLAAFESKEMSSPIEKLTHPVALPDWQDLRADVQITQ